MADINIHTHGCGIDVIGFHEVNKDHPAEFAVKLRVLRHASNSCYGALEEVCFYQLTAADAESVGLAFIRMAEEHRAVDGQRIAQELLELAEKSPPF